MTVDQVRTFVAEAGEPYPMILLENAQGVLRVAMKKDELGTCGGDAQAFVRALRQKNILPSSGGESNL